MELTRVFVSTTVGYFVELAPYQEVPHGPPCVWLTVLPDMKPIELLPKKICPVECLVERQNNECRISPD